MASANNVCENTEVKVPFNQSQILDADLDLIDVSVTPMLTNTNRTAVEVLSGESVPSTPAALLNEDEDTDMVEYCRLAKLADDLPSDMFVNQLLVDYGNCDIKLEQTRQN